MLPQSAHQRASSARDSLVTLTADYRGGASRDLVMEQRRADEFMELEEAADNDLIPSRTNENDNEGEGEGEGGGERMV